MTPAEQELFGRLRPAWDNFFRWDITVTGWMADGSRASLAHSMNKINDGEAGAAYTPNISRRINDIQASIASAVEEQTATTNEMGRNVAQAAAGSGEIASSISGVADAAHATTSALSRTQDAATELSGISSQLRSLVGRFTL